MKINKKPKVGIFTKPIDQGTSGSGTYLRELVNHILKINNKFKIVLIHYSKNDNEIYSKTDELIISKNPILATITLIKEKFDILHYYPLTILSPIWFLKAKKITSVHGGGATKHLFPYHYSKANIIHSKFIKPYLFRRMDYIFSGSKASRHFITNQYNVKKRKVFLTYSAVDNDFVVDKNKPNKIKEKYRIDKPFIFHLSKFSIRKNPWTILKAFNILMTKAKDFKLIISGSGWNNRNVMDYIINNNLDNKIILTGFIPKNDVIGLLNTAEVFVFPSYFEGFGIPNLEAMACGCPVITSRAFAIPEVVGDAALLLENNEDANELADKILQIFENKDLKNNLVNKGFERVKLYSWERSAKEVLRIYEKCLKKNNR